MIKIIHISEGLRILKRAFHVKMHSIKRYKGNSKKICKKILDDCYNSEKGYYQVSNGHFCEFYSRDFGWICKSLIELGYKEKVKSTLEYALNVFRNHGRIRVAISPKAVPFDFPNYAVDSLAYMLNSIALLNDKGLIDKYRLFLSREVDYFYKTVVDNKTGLVRKDRHFSSMKDHAKRQSSCYDNCMLYLIQESCKKLALENPLRRFDYNRLLKDNFWTGSYFLDDLSGKRYVAGDANVFPFWTGAIKDKNMLKKTISTVRKHGLDNPFPLRYTSEDNKKIDMKAVEIFAKDYERHIVWTHMAMPYIEITGWIDKRLQKKYLNQYKDIIIKNMNYLEVFFPDKRPYHTGLYYSDEGMSWCANYLELIKKLKLKP